jgi:hypothetical protein
MSEGKQIITSGRIALTNSMAGARTLRLYRHRGIMEQF